MWQITTTIGCRYLNRLKFNVQSRTERREERREERGEGEIEGRRKSSFEITFQLAKEEEELREREETKDKVVMSISDIERVGVDFFVTSNKDEAIMFHLTFSNLLLDG